jgi:hypothetical protein
MADDVIVNIKTETSDALKNIDKFQKDAGSALAKVEKGFLSLKNVAAAAVAFFAGREVIQFFEDSIEGATQKQNALKGLEQQLNLTGEATEETLAQFAAFADELERTTKFEDDAIISATGLAKSMGLTNEEAEKAVKAGVELSALYGGDLDTNVKNVAKSFSGQTSALEKQIPALKSLTKEQQHAGAAADYILKRFGGTAAAQINTFAGAVGQLSKAWGNIQEVFGTVIIENGTLIFAISKLTEGLNELEDWVKNNRETMDAFITDGVKALAEAIKISLTVLDALIFGFQNMVLAAGYVYQGFVEVERFLANVWVATFKVVNTALAELTKGLIKVFEWLTPIGLALKALGVDFDVGVLAVDKFSKGLNKSADGLLKGFEDASDGAESFINGTTAKFRSFNNGFDAIRGGIEKVAQSVIDSDLKSGQSAKKASETRSQYTRTITRDADEVKKLMEELKRFEDTLFKSAASETEKLALERANQLREIERFEKEHVLKKERGAQLRLVVEQQYTQKISELRQKDLDELAKFQLELAKAGTNEFEKFEAERDDQLRKVAEFEKKLGVEAVKGAELRAKINKDYSDKVNDYLVQQAKKTAEEMRAAVESAANNPVKFVIDKFDIPPIAFQGFQDEIAAAAGAFGKILEGKEGARSLFTNGAAIFADALLPGIGPAVAPIVDALSRGPEHGKAMVKEFVDNIPVFTTAIAESVPAIVEALVDSLINEGGAIRIGQSIMRAMYGEAIAKSLGKQLGLDFGEAFNADNVARKLAGGIDEGVARFQASLNQFFTIAPQRIGVAITEGFRRGLQFLINLPQMVDKAFANVVRLLVYDLPAGLRNAFNQFVVSAPRAIAAAGALLVEGIRTAGLQMITGITSAFTAGALAISASLTAGVNYLTTELPKALIAGANSIIQGLTAFFSPSGPFTAAFTSAGNAIKGAFDNLFNSQSFQAIKQVFSDLSNKLSGFRFPDFPEPKWVRDLKDFFAKLNPLGNVSGSGGGSKKGPITGIPGSPYAEGGVVPGGFPNDTYPALLSSGERVLTPTQTSAFERLVTLLEQGGGQGQTAPTGQPMVIQLQVGEQQLAKVMINLQRQGYRLVA